MAADELEPMEDDLEVIEEQEDNAGALTSGFVIGTTVVLLVALFLMFKALGQSFEVGPFAS